MTERLRVTVADGKYTVEQREDGNLFLTRHCERRDVVNYASHHRWSGLILALAREVDELRLMLEATRQERDGARSMFDRERVECERLKDAVRTWRSGCAMNGTCYSSAKINDTEGGY